MDKPEENLTFKKKFNFPFPLLCDLDGKISLAYGAAAYSGASFANRISYLIDEKGVISKAFSKVIPAEHAEELLKLL